MKRIFTILASAFFITVVFAQSPEKMSYQAVVRNSSNQLVINQAIGMKISILQGTSNGTVVYQETYNPNPQTNANGLVAVEIGGGIPMIGTFGSIDWSAGPYFIKTETDPNGGTNYTISGTSQILSVPYALHAKTAEVVIGGKSETDPVFTVSQAANITSNDITNLSNLSGMNTGDQNLSNFVTTTALTNGLDGKVDKVTGKGLSTEDYTIAEKTKLAGIITGAEANVQPDWNQATNTADDYVKNKPANIDEDKTDDVTLTGNQTIGGNKTFTGTTTVLAPVNATDAATKAYVDMIMKKIYTQIAGGPVKDADGNTYNTVKIGDQVWMAENLKTTKYNDSTDIDTFDYRWYNNDEESYKNIYGGLYNYEYFEKICPAGWHVPSMAEWKYLFVYLDEFKGGGGGIIHPSESMSAGGKLKEQGTIHWKNPNTEATDEIGFTALPGGGYQGDMGDLGEASFYGLGEYAYFYCFPPTPGDEPIAFVTIPYDSGKANIYEIFEWFLSYKSIRCIKD